MRVVHATTLLLLVPIISLSACVSPRANPFLSQNADILPISATEAALKAKQAAAMWNERNKRDSLKRFLILEEALARPPYGNSEIWVNLAYAHSLFADFFCEDWNEKAEHWELGKHWAEKAILLGRSMDKPPEEILSSLKRADMPALYWYALNLAGWSTRQGLSIVLKYRTSLKKMMDRVEELWPDYQYSGTYRFNGLHSASSPGFTHEDLGLSRKYFEAALKRHPEVFVNRIWYAKYYAEKAGDDALYQQQLDAVIQGNPKTPKEIYPEQILEQERAIELRSRH